MACATPLVSTPQAVSAVEAQAGTEVYVAQEPEEFARAVVGLLADPLERDRLGRAGRRFVEQHHHWAAIAQKLEDLYLYTLDRKSE
jgi:glycosyltransferase involved in cell wall biosynthesis